MIRLAFLRKTGRFLARAFVNISLVFMPNIHANTPQNTQVFQQDFWKTRLTYNSQYWKKTSNIGNIFLQLQPINNPDYQTSLFFTAHIDFNHVHQDRAQFKKYIQQFKQKTNQNFNYNYQERTGYFSHKNNHNIYQYAYDYQVGSSQLSAYTRIMACENRMLIATLMSKQGELSLHWFEVKKILDSMVCF